MIKGLFLARAMVSLPASRNQLQILWKMAKKTISCIFIFTSLLAIGYSTTAPNLERLALLNLLKALNDSQKIIKWDTHLVSPCDSWHEVTCRNEHVVALSLSSVGFLGTLSPSITELKYLENLELQDNQLHGPLPDYLGSLVNLQNLNLSKNRFSGSIPSSWNRLSNLEDLDLSYNNLNGRVPLHLFSVPTFNFTGTKLICGHSLDQPCFTEPSPPSPDSAKKSEATAFIIAASISAFFLLLVGAIFMYFKHRLHMLSNEKFVDVVGEDDREISFGQVKRFSWREIQLATSDFSESNIIGQGGFGKVYKGELADGTKVAVKRLIDYRHPGGEAAFLREVQLISVAVHKNLLRLIGFCTTSRERILVYPFMKNLSVAYRLRDLKANEKGLDWGARMRVALGTAHGLEYLHEHCNPKIIHRDLKAANILLDENFEAILGDFGLAKLVDSNLTHVTTQVRGTMGHIAPEYLTTGKSSEKTDVFGYGITLLELVTGQRAIDFSRLEEEEDVLLLDHIKRLLTEKRIHDIVDVNLEAYNTEEVEMIVKVALLCTQNAPEQRPNMAEVVTMLRGAGLIERWDRWERLEEEGKKQELTQMAKRFAWANESLDDQEEVMQLSTAR
ncbi:hypothetical protein V2J09_019712 [Rumex salicifolius]